MVITKKSKEVVEISSEDNTWTWSLKKVQRKKIKKVGRES